MLSRKEGPSYHTYMRTQLNGDFQLESRGHFEEKICPQSSDDLALLWEVNFSPLCCGHCVLGKAALIDCSFGPDQSRPSD